MASSNVEHSAEIKNELKSPSNVENRINRYFLGRIIILTLMSGGMILSHYITPTEPHHSILHDIYRRILYLPVILSAFWFGWRGGLICAFLIGASYFPHIYHDWGGNIFNVNLNRTLEALMYLIVGLVTGILVDRLRKTYRKLQVQSEQLQMALDELKDKTNEVFKVEKQLRHADRLTTIGQLTTGLAHEIRNPLGSIRGVAEILGNPNTKPEKREEFSRIMLEETERLDQVLTNFLDFAKSQSLGKPSKADIKLVTDRSLTLLGMKIKYGDIVLKVEFPDDLSFVNVSEALLQQVMLNLLLNSIQAMPNGGTLNISAFNDLEKGVVVIAISDTGLGIPEYLRERIFEPFFTTKSGGTGLGLSIVQKIVMSNRGTVLLDQSYKNGTRILVDFPCE